MECGVFDIGCHVAAFLAPVIFWAKVIFICVACVLYAALLLWAYRKAGWWGVGIVLSFGAAGAIFKMGSDFGQKWHELPAKPEKRPNRPQDPSKPLFPELDELLKDILNANRKR